MFPAFVLAVLGMSDPTPPLAPIEAAVLAAREAIRDLHLVAEIDTLDQRLGEGRTRYRYETWYEQGRQRTEVTPLDEATRKAKGQLPYDLVLCRNCPEPGTVLSHGRGGMTVMVVKPGEPGWVGFDTGRLLAVRRLGLSFADARTLDKHPPEETVGVSRLPDFTQGDEVVDGRRLVRLRGRLRTGATRTVWIDPERGPSVVRVEAAGKNAAPSLPDFRSVMEVEPARDEVSGAWYFRSCKQSVRLHGGNDADETITVQTLEVNRGIDPAVFTMAALNIAAGTSARLGRSLSGDHYWDGSRFVTAAQYEKTPAYKAMLAAVQPTPAVPVAPVGSDRPPAWQLAVAAVLALAGALALVRFVRRR